jgi:hypothetical protein
MRGYLSFVLAFVSMLIIVQLAEAQLSSYDFELSKAVSVQRAYSLQMNVKECMLEAVQQGAREGFSSYDSSHDVRLCRHCPDHFCIPGSLTNGCDPLLCSMCFREDEARAHAVEGAQSKLSLLHGHGFDGDFNVEIKDAALSAHLAPSPLSSNGFSLSHVRFDEDVLISFSSDRFAISGDGKIPGGCVIYDEGPSIC